MQLDAQRYLEQVRKLDELIEAKQAERARLVLLAEDVSARLPDGMPRSNTGIPSRKVENAAIKIVMKEAEIDKAIDRFVDYRSEVLENLEKLPADEYGALHRHYIQYKTWDAIAEEMGFSRTHIWRIHKKGLKILADVIECNIKK